MPFSFLFFFLFYFVSHSFILRWKVIRTMRSLSIEYIAAPWINWMRTLYVSWRRYWIIFSLKMCSIHTFLSWTSSDLTKKKFLFFFRFAFVHFLFTVDKKELRFCVPLIRNLSGYLNSVSSFARSHSNRWFYYFPSNILLDLTVKR